MGLSHLSMLNAHPDVSVVGVCDSSGFMLSVIGKYTGLDDLLQHGLDAG